MYDRAMQALYALALDPIQEATADPNSYGFRIGRSCQDAMGQIQLMMGSSRRPEWVLEGDIKGCFDNFSHQWMMDNIPMDKHVLKEFIKAGYVFGNQLFPTETGSPQGGVISPILANMVLNGMEKLVKSPFPRANLTRFADDFVVTVDSPETAEKVGTFSYRSWLNADWSYPRKRRSLPISKTGSISWDGISGNIGTRAGRYSS